MRHPVVLALVVLLAIVSVVSLNACRGAQPAANAAPATAAAPAANADPKAFTGTVAETMNGGGYTYARLQAQGKDDVWIAAPEFATKNGEQLSVALEMPMPNFESKTLNRSFPLVYFVTTVSRDGQVVAGAPAGTPAEGEKPRLMTSHGAPADTPPITVEPIAPPAGGLSIADLWAQRKALSGKEVTIRGKVVKANNGILGTNWIHLQDGSGSAKDRTNDITITTSSEVQVGDVITITGVLATGKDIGSGYAYDAIVENARLVK
jgi:hypothetical protein